MRAQKLIMAAAMAAGFCVGRAQGDAIVTAGTGGYWTNITTWVGGVVPGINDDVTITNGCTVTIRTNIVNDVKSLTIQSGGVLTHADNVGSESYKVILNVANDLNIAGGGKIDVDGKGYAMGYGPGNGNGGSHGGSGAYGHSETYPSPTYGSITAPTNCGSGGEGNATNTSGGGAIILMVAGTTTVDGMISANGAPFPSEQYAFAGSGGSVFLTTGHLTGNGTIRAIGGGTEQWYPGGGGRVAVVLTNDTSFGSVKMEAYSGVAFWRWGAPGTIYKQTSAQGPGKGTLVIDANGLTPMAASSTLIWSNVTDAAVGTVIITNAAVLVVTNQVLTVQGDWINRATFTGMFDGTVKFAGTNAAAIRGHNTFYNLVCTNADKVLSFEEGKTNTVNGTLTLAGVTLDSIYGSAAWYLKASANTHSVSNVTVGQSDARPGATIEAFDSTDLGGNFKWVFAKSGFSTNIWTGMEDSDWNNTNNWSRNRSTIFTDTVVIPTNVYNNYPRLDFDKRMLSLAISNGASVGLNNFKLVVDDDVRVGGTLTASGTEKLTVGGDLDFTGGTFSAATSTVWIAGSTAQTVVSAGNAFYQLAISNSAAPVVFADAVVASNIVNQATPVTFAGSVTVASTFRTQGTNVTFGGAVTVPTFDNRNGALVFSGTVATVGFTNWQGDLTFRDDFSSREFYGAPGGMAFTFKDGKMCTIGNWEVYGRNGYPIMLRSSLEGSAWNLNVTNWSKVRQVDVKDSDASAGQTIRPVASANSGNNTNWDFGGPWQTWVGTVSPSFTNANNWMPAGTPGESAHLLIDGYGTTSPVLSGVATAAQVIVGSVTTATLTVNGNLTTLEDVEVLPNGTITHSPNGGSEDYKLQLTVGSNLTVHGAINVDGKGYSAKNGPGKGNAGSHGGGGAYGHGETAPAPTYGSITFPTNCGSGGDGYAGGGAIILTVTGTTTVNGAISANGSPWPYSEYAFAGAGGSVFLTTGRLAGNGTIRAVGGGTGQWYPGGGGRIAVVLTNDGGFDTVTMKACSGSAYWMWGGAGTIYTQTRDQGPGKGILLIDANGRVPMDASSTLIRPGVTDTTVGTVIITNAGKLAVSNQTLTVQGDWVNSATFIAMTNGKVDFAGTNTATIYTNNTFFNFTSTNAGKTLVFEAGRTNTVTGLLKLGAAQSGQMVTLRSTTNGSWSYLTLVPGGTQQIARVSVKDSNAGGGQTLLANVGSANGGNNINWQFPPSGTMFMVK